MCYDVIMDINNYIELYNKGVLLKNIKPLDNEEYRRFLQSSAKVRIVPKKIINYNKHIELISGGIAKNLKTDPYFYMIPIQTPSGTIVGFTCRLLFESKYINIMRKTKGEGIFNVPKMFGWLEFKNYDEE